MGRRNYRKEAIDIVFKDDCLRRDLIVEIAKNNPSALCHAYDSLKPDRFKSVIEYIKQNEKLKAIKEYRHVTGVGLKEAKEAVENMNY